MNSAQNSLENQISTVRAFSRFYTRQIGLLNEGLLNSDFALTEVRVLYELAHRDDLTATEIGRDLGIDPGYLSRLLKKFEAQGLITRTPSESDARQSILALTGPGRTAFAPLEQASHDQIAEMLDPLPSEDRERLVLAMTHIRRIMGGTACSEIPFSLRPQRPGDIGWITHRQAVLYHREYGWDESFEALVAEIAAGFVNNFDPGKERCWIAERDGEVVGSVFLVRQSDEVAKLRLLYVEPSARGLGIGQRLVGECISFARGKDYRSLTLWTNDILVAARKIYQAAGFKLVAEERHRSFGKDLVGQNWELEL